MSKIVKLFEVAMHVSSKTYAEMVFQKLRKSGESGKQAILEIATAYSKTDSTAMVGHAGQYVNIHKIAFGIPDASILQTSVDLANMCLNYIRKLPGTTQASKTPLAQENTGIHFSWGWQPPKWP